MAVEGIKGDPSRKADGRVMNDMQFMEEVFRGWSVNNITIIKNKKDYKFNQELRSRV